MRKKTAMGTALLLCVLLAGCGEGSSIEDYQNVAEVKTREYVEVEIETYPLAEREEESELLVMEEGYPSSNTSSYISDSHFYQGDTMRYLENSACKKNAGDKMEIRILDAFTSDDIADGGSYFAGNFSTKDVLNSGYERQIYGENTYLFTRIELTNLTDQAVEIWMHHYEPYIRVLDRRLESRGYGTVRVEIINSGAMGYDQPDTEKKSYYLKKIAPGETIETTLCHVIPKQFLSETIYLKLGNEDICDYWKLDEKMGDYPPNEEENLKFLQIPLGEEKEK